MDKACSKMWQDQRCFKNSIYLFITKAWPLAGGENRNHLKMIMRWMIKASGEGKCCWTIVSLRWLLPGAPVGLLLHVVVFCWGRRHVNAEVCLAVEKGVCVSVISFLCELQRGLAATGFEILQARESLLLLGLWDVEFTWKLFQYSERKIF